MAFDDADVFGGGSRRRLARTEFVERLDDALDRRRIERAPLAYASTTALRAAEGGCEIAHTTGNVHLRRAMSLPAILPVSSSVDQMPATSSRI